MSLEISRVDFCTFRLDMVIIIDGYEMGVNPIFKRTADRSQFGEPKHEVDNCGPS